MEFHGSLHPTVGAEYELQLLDASSLDMIEASEPLLDLCPSNAHVGPELLRYAVEISSKVCRDVGELDEHMRAQLGMLRKTCRKLGIQLAGAGTHPFCVRPGMVTPRPRFQRVEANLGYTGHSQATFALQIHVGMRTGEQAIQVMNRLRPYLPILLALSASSPFWGGHDSGFASYRKRLLTVGHAFELPPRIGSYDEFVQLAETARRAGIFESLKDMHWDVRPRPDFGTLELRVMDSPATLSEVSGFAALARALVEHLKDDDSPRLPELPGWLERENLYRASQQGLDAALVTDATGSVRPLKDVATELLRTMRPVAERLGDASFLPPLERLIAIGGRYRQLRETFRQTNSLRAVAASLVRALEADAAA